MWPRLYSFLLSDFTQVLVEDNLPNRLTYFSLKVFLRPIMTHLRGCAKVRSLLVKSKLIFFQETRFDVFFNTLNLFISMWFSTKLDLFREKLKYAKLSDILSGYSGRQDSTDALWLCTIILTIINIMKTYNQRAFLLFISITFNFRRPASHVGRLNFCFLNLNACFIWMGYFRKKIDGVKKICQIFSFKQNQRCLFLINTHFYSKIILELWTGSY